MRDRTRLPGALTVVAALVASVMVVVGPAGAESNGGTRVVPLGDSITDGLTVPRGYRIDLWAGGSIWWTCTRH